MSYSYKDDLDRFNEKKNDSKKLTLNSMILASDSGLDPTYGGDGSGGNCLPEVTAEDNGDVLTVVDGEWDKAAPSGGSLIITLTDETSRWINPDTGDPAQSFCMYPDPTGYIRYYAIVPEAMIQQALSGVQIAITDEQETEPQFTDYLYLFSFAVQRYELEGGEIDPTDVNQSSFYSPDDIEVAVVSLASGDSIILLPDTATYLPPTPKVNP